MQRFGGCISCKSIPYPALGHGSTFTFTFKLETFELERRESCNSNYEVNSKRILFSSDASQGLS